MIRTLSGAFRTSQIPALLGLNLYNVGITIWDGGATIIDPLTLNPLPSERWSIISYSVSGDMYYTLTPAAAALGYAPYGKLGKITSSLLLGTDFINPTKGVNPTYFDPVAHPALPFPTDLSTRMDLWDPAVDNLPQQLPFGIVPKTAPQNGYNAPLRIANTLNLPEPALIPSGAQPIGIGMWLSPSLFNQGGGNFPMLMVLNARYSITYDDGH